MSDGELMFSKNKQLGFSGFESKTRTRMRRELMEKILVVWSQIVRKTDGYKCQWFECKESKYIQGHHIVPRSRCNNPGIFDKRNGMSLCRDHHIHGVKRHRRIYHQVRDSYLERMGRPSYEELRRLYNTSGMRMDMEELRLMLAMLKADLKNL